MGVRLLPRFAAIVIKITVTQTECSIPAIQSINIPKGSKMISATTNMVSFFINEISLLFITQTLLMKISPTTHLHTERENPCTSMHAFLPCTSKIKDFFGDRLAPYIKKSPHLPFGMQAFRRGDGDSFLCMACSLCKFCFSYFYQCGKACCIVYCHLSKHFSVDFYFCQFQTIHEFAV